MKSASVEGSTHSASVEGSMHSASIESSTHLASVEGSKVLLCLGNGLLATGTGFLGEFLFGLVESSIRPIELT